MADKTRRLPIRGGNWNNGANAGLAALNLNNRRSNSNNNVGFRPALSLQARYRGFTGHRSAPREKGVIALLFGENIYRYGRPVGDDSPTAAHAVLL